MTSAFRLWLGLLAVVEAVRRGERGQSAVEFIGVLALIALIVLALTQSELLSGARRAVSEAVGDLFRPSN
jgi:Flp pilus assembly pilin Flp